MTKNLNIRTNIIKLLEENIGVNFHDPGLGNGFLYVTPIAQATKGKKSTSWTSSKLKNLCFKDTMKKVKRQAKEWEKIFANHISDKGLISRTYKTTI